MTKEDGLQIAVANFLRVQYPKILFCHIANERKTSQQRGKKLKDMGVQKGMPDLMIFHDMQINSPDSPHPIKYNGLAIELKIKPNKPSPEQIDILHKLNKAGWKTKVCFDFDDTINTINNYLKPRNGSI